MVLRRGHHDGVHIDAGEPHQTGVQGAVLHHVLHLDDDLAAGVLGGLGDGQGLGADALPLEGAVAVGVSIGGPDHGHVDGQGLVQKPGLPADLDALHQGTGLPGPVVEHAALQLRVREGLQAHVGDEPRLAGGNVPEKLGDHALRVVVGGALVFQRQLLEPGHQAPVAADDPVQQALLAQVVEAPLARVALSGGVDGGEPLGRTGVQVELLDGLVDLLRHHGADEASAGDGGAVVDVGADGLLCGHDSGHEYHFLSDHTVFVLLSRRCGRLTHSFGKNGCGCLRRPA